MCGRYVNHIDDLRDWASILEDWPGDVASGFNVAPTQTVPAFTADGGRGMRWGLIPAWSKDSNPRYATFNARIETLDSKPAFRGAWRKGRRCLIPALGYYEWRLEDGAKQPYFVHDPNGGPLVFGGLWEAPGDGGFTPYSCTIITRPAEGAMCRLHDRTPLLLTPAQALTWLSAAPPDAAGLATEPPAMTPSFYPVSKAVNNVRNQGPDLVAPIDQGAR